MLRRRDRSKRKRDHSGGGGGGQREKRRREVVNSSGDVLSLYLIYNDCKDVKTRTYIGCVEDVMARLLQHNGITEPTPKQTRKAQGHWKLLCILLVPPEVREEVSTKEIKKLWRFKSRGVERRIRRGVQLSKQFNLYCFLSESLLDETSSHGWELNDLIKEYHEQRPKRQLFMRTIASQCGGGSIPSSALSLEL